MNSISKAIDSLIEGEPLFTNPVEFDDSWLDKFIDGTWTRREDGKIDTLGTVRLNNMDLTELPYEFGEVKGYFYCVDNSLTTLKGCPEIVRKGFDCSNNQLTSLEGGPEIVGLSYNCRENPLKSLQGAPEYVYGDFMSNKFTDKEYRAYVEERDE